MKYSKWIGMFACLALVVVCFLPWTYHADLQKTFTGFFSEKNAYGKPGKYIVIFCAVAVLLFLAGKVWAQRTLLFVSGLLLSYAIKTYILYSSCYNAYCPEKLFGIYGVLICSVVIMVAAVFPQTRR